MNRLRPFPFVGHAPHILRKGLLNFIVEMCADTGQVTTLAMGPRVAHVVTHPDHVRYVFSNTANYIKGTTLNNLRLLLGEGLVTSDGELWRRERSLVQAAFQRERMAGLLGLCVRPVQNMLANWDRGGAITVLDMHREVRRLVFIISGLTLFGCNLEDNADEARQALATALGIVSDRNENAYALPLWVPTPGNLKLRKAIGILDRHVEEIIEQRRGSAAGDDVLSVLLRAKEAGSDTLTDRQLRDEVITLYLAGHDATAHSLTWVLYFLGFIPKCKRDCARRRRGSSPAVHRRSTIFGT